MKMERPEHQSRLDRIIESAERTFGRTVTEVTAPGGEGRSSYRLFIGDRAMIATLRPNFRRTHLEAFVLRALSAECDDVPECLGVDGEIMFQADVGDRRLNREIMNHDEHGQIDLADQAVGAIFRYQRAARACGLAAKMPHLGATDAWVEQFVDAVDALEQFATSIPASFDRAAACELIARPGTQFVKWDCRSGNAALDRSDKLRWFDFEYCGTRHGAEDLAWLVADEAWPLAPETMLDVIEDNFDADCGHAFDDYLAYLSAYVSFHSVQRLKLILKEARKRGWISKARVRQYDDAGVHPEFAAHICDVGRFYASLNPVTAPLCGCFEVAGDVFRTMIKRG